MLVAGIATAISGRLDNKDSILFTSKEGVELRQTCADIIDKRTSPKELLKRNEASIKRSLMDAQKNSSNTLQNILNALDAYVKMHSLFAKEFERGESLKDNNAVDQKIKELTKIIDLGGEFIAKIPQLNDILMPDLKSL